MGGRGISSWRISSSLSVMSRALNGVGEIVSFGGADDRSGDGRMFQLPGERNLRNRYTAAALRVAGHSATCCTRSRREVVRVCRVVWTAGTDRLSPLGEAVFARPTEFRCERYRQRGGQIAVMTVTPKQVVRWS